VPSIRNARHPHPRPKKQKRAAGLVDLVVEHDQLTVRRPVGVQCAEPIWRQLAEFAAIDPDHKQARFLSPNRWMT
jgi:hypothetical protein